MNKRRKPRTRTPERKRKKIKSHPICNRVCNSLGLLILYSLIDLLFFKNEFESDIIKNILTLTIVYLVFNCVKNMIIYLQQIDEDTRKNYLYNKAIEFVISWYLYKYMSNYPLK